MVASKQSWELSSFVDRTIAQTSLCQIQIKDVAELELVEGYKVYQVCWIEIIKDLEC